MSSDSVHRPRKGRANSIIKWTTISIILIALTLPAGIGVAALLGRSGTAETWRLRADVGEAFGVVTAIFSGLALVALLVTFWVQFQELRVQRGELAGQRKLLDRLQTELYRTAEANLRTLHFELLKMSIEDAELASVWPSLRPGLAHEINRKYLYANLIYQHVWLSFRIGDYSERQIQNHLRYLFLSPTIREYWQAATTARTSLVKGTPEYRLATLADEICQEYEGVLASASRDADNTRLPDEAPH